MVLRFEFRLGGRLAMGLFWVLGVMERGGLAGYQHGGDNPSPPRLFPWRRGGVAQPWVWVKSLEIRAFSG